MSGAKRFEGTFILAPSGSGKTTLLNYLISEDMKYVPDVSIVVMDNTGDFLRNVTRHPDIKKHQDRLVVIEPDAEHPIALNPFAYGRSRIKQSKGNDRVRLTNQSIELLTHVFSSVGENTAFTPRQRLVFGHCVRLCMAIPDATMQTLHDILATAYIEPYKQYFGELSEEAQSFFNTTFIQQDIRKVCQVELLWRVQLVLENEAFAPMVKAPECKLDFFELLNDGAIVIVHADRNLLGGREAVAVFGRLIIALIRLAMKQRDPIPESQRKPVYLYIDECQHFVEDDKQVSDMLNDVRKSKLAMAFATQRLANIKDATVKDALLSCGIIVARPTGADANAVSNYTDVSSDIYNFLRPYSFMVSARGVTKGYEFQLPDFKFPYAEDLSALIRQAKAKYTYKVTKTPPREVAREVARDDGPIKPKSQPELRLKKK